MAHRFRHCIDFDFNGVELSRCCCICKSIYCSNTVHDIQSVNICVYDYIELYLNVSNFDWDALQTCMTLKSNEWVFAFSSFRFFFLDLIRTLGLLTASFALWII